MTTPLPPGTILLKKQIAEFVEAGQLIKQDTFDPIKLDICSYDVRAGDKAMLGGDSQEKNIEHSSIELAPGAYAAVISLESLKIPTNILARINVKRSFAYDGIILLTGTQIDPGYEGHLLFGFYNASPRKISIRKERPICSVVFEVLSSDVPKGKGHDPDLILGRFPQDLMDKIGNMDTLSLHQISEHVKRIDTIANELLTLREKYENITKPIGELTEIVNSLTKDITANRDDITKTSDTAKSVLTSLEIMKGNFSKTDEQVQQQQKTILDLYGDAKGNDKFREKIWAVVIVIVSVILTFFVTQYLITDQPQPNNQPSQQSTNPKP